ncbi:unnamed protein product [Paramecium pentaurelia]|uniref:Uncharacterized protein n=1 Tax=Paramecium pentaurelia TaxID=43138 RepID=A0A8S1WL42_9CILI|nr:unnamed protein product [Paramecium pentaurelia]
MAILKLLVIVYEEGVKMGIWMELNSDYDEYITYLGEYNQGLKFGKMALVVIMALIR